VRDLRGMSGAAGRIADRAVRMADLSRGGGP